MDNKEKVVEKLKSFKINALRNIAIKKDIPSANKLKYDDLVDLIAKSITEKELNQILSIASPQTRIKKFGFLVSKYIAFIALVAGLNADVPGLLSRLPIYDRFSSSFKIPEICKEREECVKVLVLPFQKYDTKEAIQAGKIINLRLNILSLKDSLSLSSYYCETCPVGVNFNIDSALMLMNYFDLDVVVFGGQMTGKNNNDDEISVNYVANEQYKDSFREYIQESSDDFEPSSSRDLLKGELQGSLDYVVYGIASVIEKNRGNPSLSLKYYTHIYDSLEIKDERTLEELVILLLQNGKVNESIQRIDEYKYFLLVPTIEQWLYFYSLKIMIYSRGNLLKELMNVIRESEMIFNSIQLPKNLHTAERYHKMGEFIAPHDPDYAILFIQSALDMFQEFRQNDDIAKCYHELGRAYYFKSQYFQAAEKLEKALELYDKNKKSHQWLIIRAYQLLGLSQLKIGKYIKGERCLKKSVGLINNTKAIHEAVFIQFEAAKELSKKKEFAKSIRWLKRGVESNRMVSNYKVKAVLQFMLERNLGSVYMKSKDHQSAINWFNQAKETWNNIPNKTDEECNLILDLHSYLCMVFKKINEPNKVKILAKEGIELAQHCKE